MVELKDVLLIGAVGGAGLLAYKAFKGGKSIIPTITLPEDKTIVDYDQVKEYQKLLEEDRGAFAKMLEELLKKAQGTTPSPTPSPTPTPTPTPDPIPDPDPDDDDGESYDGKKLTELSDVITFTLEKAGEFGQIRKAEAAVTENFDSNNTARLNAVGGLGGVIGLGDPGANLTTDLASFVGLTPAAAGTVGAVESLASGYAMVNPVRIANANTSLAFGIKSLGESIYDGLKSLF